MAVQWILLNLSELMQSVDPSLGSSPELEEDMTPRRQRRRGATLQCLTEPGRKAGVFVRAQR